MGFVSSSARKIVTTSVAYARAISIIAVALGLIAGLYDFKAFAIRTNLDSLISADLPWRSGEAEVAREFPDQGDDIIAVIDGDTPELAERAAAALAKKLRGQTDLYVSLNRLNGGALYDRERLLFLPVADVQKVTNTLIGAQPLLAPIAADPSLRGLLVGLDTGLAAIAEDSKETTPLSYPVSEIGRVLSETEKGNEVFLSWDSFLSDRRPDPTEWRQFIELIPKLDFSRVAPGEAGVAGIRQAVQDLGLTADKGVRVRLTGSVPILDDEFSTLEETSGPVAMLAVFCMLVILYLALRSVRLIFCVVLTLTIGAALTSAVGLLAYGRFNLISVAFLPLFIGLGIDFAIQYCVRVRTELSSEQRLGVVLPQAAASVGRGLALAATAIAIGFFAFVPTDYRGISELGFIAGSGIVIAFVLTVTLLPALISLTGTSKARAEPKAWFRFDADKHVIRFRIAILSVGLVLAVAGVFALPLIKFNFDPMRLRSLKSESVSTYLELSRNVETTPNTVAVLAPTLADAMALADRIAALPQVGRTVTLDTFIPKDQAPKLALIEDAHNLLDLSLNPFETAPPPTDAQLVEKILDTERRLRKAQPVVDGSFKTSIGELADSLARLAKGSPEDRLKAQTALLAGFPTALTQVNASLTAKPITRDALPALLRRQWVSPQGAALIQVFPKNDLSTPALITNFVHAVQSVAPSVSGAAVDVVESGRTILHAFFDAGLFSAVAIIALLFVALRNVLWVALAITPVLLSGLLMFGTCVAFGVDVNLENMIALPLLLAIGVAFNIYFIVAWRSGTQGILNSSLTSAIIFSALTTGTAFASLSLSAHPGTASMGVLLLIALFWIVATTMTFLPALLSVSVGVNRDIAA